MTAAPPTSFAVREFTRNFRGVEERHRIAPLTYVHQTLAAQLADAWLEVATEASGSGNDLARSLREFLTFMDTQPAAADKALTLEGLRLRHLNAFEGQMAQRQKEVRSDSPYRAVIYLFALLRRIEEDNPGTLHAEVLRRLESTTRLPHIRRDGDPEYQPNEVRALRGAAHREVHKALQTAASGQPVAMTPHLCVALHILWSLGTGEPPEVVREVTLDDIILTPTLAGEAATAGVEGAARVHALAASREIDQIAVTFYKARTGLRYTRVYTRAHRSAFKAICATIRLGEWDRAACAPQALWVTTSGDGTPARTNWRRLPLGEWIHDRLPDRTIEGPHAYRRLRKTVTTREALANPSRYLRDGKRHSAGTFFDHYTNSKVLRAHAGKIVVESVSDLFEAAVTAPTVITRDAEELLLQGEQVDALDEATFTALENGELDTTMAACRDPLDSPHTPKGHPCSVSGTGDCFACPNALILPRHLPAVVRLAELTAPERAANRDVWDARWRAVNEAINDVILPEFSPEDVEAARQAAGSVLLDPTLINDLAGVQE